MANKGRRDGNLSVDQQRMLIQGSACLCEFENCGVPLYYDFISAEVSNFGEYAHIIPSSDIGPRGGECDDIEYISSASNRIHLCLKHHKLVDSKPLEYPASRLRAMKERHEKMVLAFQKSLTEQPILPVVLEAKIKQQDISRISITDVSDAIRDEGVPRCEMTQYSIVPYSETNHEDSSYWDTMCAQIARRVECLKENDRSLAFGRVEYGLFALAPIPLIAYFGYLVGDKVPSRVFQLLRDESKWSWKRASSEVRFATEVYREKEVASDRVALVISLSFDILNVVFPTIPANRSVYCLKVDTPSVNCISAKQDLECFVNEYLQTMGRIQKENPGAEIDLYAAVPVSAAIEIGRRYMPKAFPRTTIYEKVCDKWVKACVLD